MSTRWVKVWRDVNAARGRLTMVVGALTVSLTAVVTMLTTWAVLDREVPRSYIGSNPASAQLAIGGNLAASTLDAVRHVPNVAAAELASTLMARIDVGNGEWLPLLLFVVPSFDSLRINTLHPDSGRWPAPDGSLAIERSAIELTHAGVGRAVNIDLAGIGRRSIPIAAIVHDPGVAPAWQEQVVYGYVTSATLSALGVSEPLDVLKLVVRDGVTDPSAIERTARRVADVLIASGQRVYQVRIPPPQQHPHQRQMNAIVVMLLAFSLLVLVLGAVLASGVISAWLAQQARDIAIMKAIGAVSTQISALYVAVVAALGVLGTLLGVPIGLLLGRQFIGLVATLLNLRLESLAIPGWIYVVALGLGIGAPLLAAALPILRASRRTVRA
ncbi:MAG: ABC transporter permease, partial [Gemmatimonadaceae bacterium]|nr:ABC transporter permease [Gemmatimonadaceae bacterium]